MAAPIVSWRVQNNSAVLNNWNIGTVDAGFTSDNISFLVWNNHNGSEDVSDMQNCVITTKDSSGGNTGEVVLNTWIEVRVDSLSEGSFTPIGGETTKTIRTNGSTTNVNGTFTPNVAPHAGSGTSYDILGVLNDGTKLNSAGNFVEITARANVPSNAGAGSTNFRVRVAYQYV
jgi:hypothetical protein